MGKTKLTEKEICDYYNNIWSQPIKLVGRDKNLLLGFHYGLYEKGIKTWKEAAINMNDYVGRLLDLDTKKTLNILDVGCGVGSTSFYLADKYQNINFTGLTLSPEEIKLAEKYQKEKKISNTNFIKGNFQNTTVSDLNFDGIFALESFCYSINKEIFLNEMNRILKKGGRLVILDGFRTKKNLSSFMNKIYNSFIKRRKIPSLVNIDFIKTYIEKLGYKDIIIEDITGKGMLKNFIQRDFISYIFQYVKNYFMKFFRKENEKNKSDIDYIMTALVPEFLLGMCKIIRYYSISSIKK